MLRFAAVLLPLALAAPVAGIAQQREASPEATFQAEFHASDTNKDGSLSLAEVQARIAKMRVGPGKPDPAHAKRLATLWFNNADLNHDGKVTEKEADTLLRATIAAYQARKAAEAGSADGPKDNSR